MSKIIDKIKKGVNDIKNFFKEEQEFIPKKIPNIALALANLDAASNADPKEIEKILKDGRAGLERGFGQKEEPKREMNIQVQERSNARQKTEKDIKQRNIETDDRDI